MAPRLRYPVTPLGPAPKPKRPPEQPKRRTEGSVRLVVPSIAMCSILALSAQVLLGDTFVLSSASMEPRIIGRPGTGDRLLVSSAHLAVQGYERFQILLFHLHNNVRARFLKRLVGLQREQIEIRGGDLWLIDPSFFGDLESARRQGKAIVIKKDPAMQESFLQTLPVVTESELRDLTPDAFERHFLAEDGQSELWQVTDRSAVFQGANKSLVRFRRPLTDVIPDRAHPPSTTTGHPPFLGGQEPVGDLSFDLEVNPDSGAGPVLFELDDAVAAIRVSARLGVGQGAETAILVDEMVVGSVRRALPADRWTEVRFESVDDRVTILFDGDPVLVRDISHPAPAPNPDSRVRTAPSRLGFGAERGRVQFRPRQLRRDIHYRESGMTRFRIPEGHLLFLGDNTPSSVDSRTWRRTAIRVRRTGEVLQGDALGVTFATTSAPGKNPWPEADGSFRFVDRMGQVITLKDEAEWEHLGTWSTPYVPEANLLGRVVGTVWPIRRGSWLR